MRCDRSTSSTNAPHSGIKNRLNSDLFIRVKFMMGGGGPDSTETDPSGGTLRYLRHMSSGFV